MILDEDKYIQETICDESPLSIRLLKLLDWHVQFGQHNYQSWTKFKRHNGKIYPYIERFSNGAYFLSTSFDSTRQVSKVKDLKEVGVL